MTPETRSAHDADTCSDDTRDQHVARLTFSRLSGLQPTFAMCTVSATGLLVGFPRRHCSSGIPCSWSSRFATLLLFRRESEPQVRSGHSQCCGTPRDLSAAGSGRVCVHRHCSVGLCAVSSKPAPSSSRGTPLAPHEGPPPLFSALEWMSVRPPKGASGTVQSRAFAPEATLCVKNVKQSKVRWMRAVLASRTELVCAPNATAVVPDCDTGHEGEFLIYANYGE